MSGRASDPVGICRDGIPVRREGTMYIRVIRARSRPGRVDELAERWRTLFVPRLQQFAGFRHAWFGGDRDLNTAVIVTLWDELPRATQLGPLIVGFEEAQLGDVLAAPSAIDEYEVLAEADPLP